MDLLDPVWDGKDPVVRSPESGPRILGSEMNGTRRILSRPRVCSRGRLLKRPQWPLAGLW